MCDDRPVSNRSKSIDARGATSGLKHGLLCRFRPASDIAVSRLGLWFECAHLLEGNSMNSPRVALVTGGGGAIGAAVAFRLARRGIRIALNDIDPQKTTETVAAIQATTNTEAMATAGDVTRRDQVAEIVRSANDVLGPVTILVHCAGIIRNAPLEEMDDAAWTSLIDVNLRGAFLTAQAVIGQMKAAGWGRIVNIASGAVRGSDRGQTNYSAAKAGLIGMTRTFAIEHGPFGITANAVAPGAIRSEMTHATAAQLGISFDEYERIQAQRSPRRRLGEPEDVANVVDFFVSEESDLVNGQVLFVTGGP